MSEETRTGSTAGVSSMVERVARAMCWSAATYPGQSVREEIRTQFVERHWRDHVRGAKAAILAMREPTEEMVAAEQALHGYSGDRTVRGYQAMIDAALGQNPLSGT